MDKYHNLLSERYVGITSPGGAVLDVTIGGAVVEGTYDFCLVPGTRFNIRFYTDRVGEHLTSPKVYTATAGNHTLEFIEDATFTIMVLDGDTPVENMFVRLYYGSKPITGHLTGNTTASGTSIANVFSEDITFKIRVYESGPEYHGLTLPTIYKASEPMDREIILRKNANYLIYIFNPDGTPVVNAKVYLSAKKGENLNALFEEMKKTDENGKVEYRLTPNIGLRIVVTN